MNTFSSPLNRQEQQKIDLTDLRERVTESADEFGCEAFGCEPWEYDTCLNGLLNSNDPYEMINFLGFNSFAEYMREEAL